MDATTRAREAVGQLVDAIAERAVELVLELLADRTAPSSAYANVERVPSICAARSNGSTTCCRLADVDAAAIRDHLDPGFWAESETWR